MRLRRHKKWPKKMQQEIEKEEGKELLRPGSVALTGQIMARVLSENDHVDPPGMSYRGRACKSYKAAQVSARKQGLAHDMEIKRKPRQKRSSFEHPALSCSRGGVGEGGEV